MKTITASKSATYLQSEELTSPFSKFFSWCKSQEHNRLLWLGIILAVHGCILTPLTVMAVLLGGTNFFLFIISIISIGMSLVTNLAAMSTKVSIPIFILSIVIDLVIVSITFVHGLNIASTYI